MAKQKKKPEFPSKEEWEAQQEALRQQQNVPEGGVPEQRPQHTIAPEPEQGHVAKALSEQGSPMAHDAPAMGYEEHKKAFDDAQKERKSEKGPERMYPGAHCYINNPKDEAMHGRAVAVNGVSEFASPEDEALANAGYNHDRRYAKVKTYECSSRDGRAELLIVNAEHLTRVPVAEYHRTRT